MRIHPDALLFQWDKGNIGKNKRHGIEDSESEEAFFDERRVIFKDTLHSKGEPRYRILGKTLKDRILFVVFTIRGKKIRVISARRLNKKEAPLYEKASKTSDI